MITEAFEVEPGVYLIFAGNKLLEARVDSTAITVRGQRFDDLFRDPRKWNPEASGASAQGRASLKAPMPGKVVRVLVAAGDSVAAGQGLVVVEAMKMQNELKSTRAGVVLEVHAQEGQTVEAGSLLAVVE